MGSWGSTANNVANSVLWAPAYVNKTVNTTNQTALSGNVTVGAWVNGSRNILMQEGVVGVSATVKNAANASSEAPRVAHTGWQIRRAGTGYVNAVASIANGGSNYVNNAVFQFTAVGTGTVNAYGVVTTNSTGGITAATVEEKGTGFINLSNTTFVAPANGVANSTNGATLAVSAAGAGYTTGDLVIFSNGQANGLGTITANSTGNIVSIAITRAGRGFSNTLNTVRSYTNSTGGATGNAIVSAAASPGGTGYANNDVITFSNGVSNATATPTTNSIGGITSITINTVGKGFANVSSIVVGVTNSTGGATGGSGATITPTLHTTTITLTIAGGADANLVPSLGGRAGRVHYETLVAMTGMTGPAVAAANNTYLPSS